MVKEELSADMARAMFISKMDRGMSKPVMITWLDVVIDAARREGPEPELPSGARPSG